MPDGLEDVTELDGDNAKWTKAYVAGLDERIAREEAADALDAEMVAYLKAERDRWSSLLQRVGKA